MTCILIYRIPAFLFTEYSHPYLPKSRILNCRKLALLFTVYSDIILLPKAERIIQKYSNHQIVEQTGQLLPVKSGQKVNEYLKEISDLCGIRKNLTWYVGRHTFATIVTLAKGVPMETLSKMLGHKRITQTQHYGKVLNLTVSKDMQKVKEFYK